MRAVETYFEVLACVAAANGTIQEQERRMLLSAAESVALPPASLARLERRLSGPVRVRLADVLPKEAERMPPETLAELLRDAYLLAAADEEILPAEVAVVDELMAFVGVRPEKRASLHEWAREAARLHLDGLQMLQESRGS